ncbi:hypothetical protein SteCoe_26196 [Stentor coeruleus]|uniref:MD-2-related lipid-recognition domain-containing protein n=1 Tax=Stentor coeruleus TaxID=5963 RepID=A0A1R2BDG6_9CILI|nr:hypothetical protein SteCoe_26196 [Stentor coeruleus]
MKVFIVAMLLLSLVSASVQLSNLKTQAGVNCENTGNIMINEFVVEPWPPVASTNSAITIEVVINKPGIGVGTITYGTLNKLQQWSYQYQVINEAFPEYSIQTFQYVIYWPSEPGNYILQTTIGGLNKPPSINACWVISYTLQKN